MPNQPTPTNEPAAQPQPFYYLDNFQQALDWLHERYADLLDTGERTFIEQFGQLPRPSRALLVRLIMRKGPHFRAAQLCYPEIGDIDQAAQPLLAHGWLCDAQPLDAEQLGQLLRKDELVALLPPATGLRTLRKPELLEQLCALNTGPRPFRQWCPDSSERLLSVLVGELCERLRLMFFGNLSQGWEEFVLAQLGILRYESVPLTRESRGFSCRADLQLYQHLHNCRSLLEQGQPVADILQLLGEPRCDNPWLHSRHARLLFQLARQLEREAASEAALQLYQRSGWKGARQRQIRILEKLQQHTQAHSLVEAALQAPEDDAELQLALRAQRRLARRLGYLPQSVATEPDNRRIELSLPGPYPLGVEHAVGEHLASPQAPVHYVENTLVTGLFGLLCWEAIFAPVPGAFFHPFHSAPADLHSPDFHSRRHELFAACLARLDSGDYQQHIRRTWQTKQGIQTPFVNWAVLSEDLLEQALHCLPATHLRLWFQRLLLDLRGNRAGMPDLIQFWPAERRYRMIEVKGPGDRLQDNQRRWLAFCARHGMPAEVCYVSWAP